MKVRKWMVWVGLLTLAGSALGAIGTNVVARILAGGLVTNPVSLQTGWTTVRDAGGVDAADASPLINPDSSITASTAHVWDLGKIGGTGFVLRFAYRSTVSTSPVVRVFGRFDASDDWMVLPNRSGDDTIELTVDTTNDMTDGTDKFTTVVLDDHYVDAMGCKYILVGVSTAQSGGTASVSYIQAKPF